MAFVVYFHSSNYATSYTAFLVAVFYSKGIVKRCEFPGAGNYYQDFFDNIYDVVLALLVVIGVDLALERRVSTRACATYVGTWRSLRDSVDSLLDPSSACITRGTPVLRGELARSALLGKEAADEPRPWRPPWPSALFASALARAGNVCLSLTNLEYAAEVHSEGEDRSKGLTRGATRQELKYGADGQSHSFNH